MIGKEQMKLGREFIVNGSLKAGPHEYILRAKGSVNFTATLKVPFPAVWPYCRACPCVLWALCYGLSPVNS